MSDATAPAVGAAEDVLWPKIDDIVQWIDRQSPMPDPMQALGMRIHKITEELGEVAQAYVGVTAYNPRKGKSHTEADLKGELCDVVLTAMVALRTIEPDAGKAFAEHLDRVHERSLGVVRSG